MDVVVLGSAGHVGGNLVRALLEAGHGVRAVVYRDTRALEGTDATLVRANILEPGSLARALDGADAVINCAVHISLFGGEDEMEAINVRGPGIVARECLKRKLRLVHFSSVHAFCQQPMDETIDETRPLADTSDAPFYDRSKALGEREVLRYTDEGLDVVILNPAGVLGPHDYKPSNMGDVILRLYRRELPGLVPGGYDFVDVRDVCTSTLEALERGRKGERYILSGHWHPVSDLGLIVEDLTGRKPPSLTFPAWLARLGAPFVEQASRITGKRPLYTRGALETLLGNSRFSHEKATAELGHEPRPLRDTVRDTIDWFRSTGPL
jgi:dihydroflavonol-4-reductase